MKISCHQNWEELEALRETWDSLLASSASDTVFLTWEWARAWWSCYGSGRSLHVLTAWEDDLLVGVAPLYIDPVRRWGVSWACLKLIGDGSNDSDYLDCFALRGRENAVIRNFFEYLESNREKWDELELHGPEEHSPCLAAFMQFARERSWKTSVETIPCATLLLPTLWSDYLQTLKPRIRTKVRSSLACVDEQIRSAPRECRSAEELEQWLPILFDLHIQRWGTAGRPGVFRDPVKRNFYREVSRLMLERGWLALHRLDWGKRPLALQYGFVYGNRFHLLQEGYDPAFEDLRPGLSLRSWMLRHWIERGLKEYDFLAGAAPYKMDLGAKQKQSLRVSIAHDRPGTWVFLDEPRVRGRMKAAVNRLIPGPVLAWRRYWQAGRARRKWEHKPVSSGLKSLSRLVRSLVSWVYSSTPAGAMGRRLLGRYTLDSSGIQSRGVLPHRRIDPILHILLYHRINDDRDAYLPSFPVAAFRAHMEHIARNFPVVGLDEIAEGKLPRNGQNYCVAVTFDDGYRDNFTHAFPILKELGIPATIFLTSGCIEQRQLAWYDQVCLAFKLTTERSLDLGFPGAPSGSIESKGDRVRKLRLTLEWFWKLSEAERLHWTRELFRALQVPEELNLPNAMLSWDEIRQMTKKNVRFGAHTVTHPVLSKLDRGRLEEEIVGSKRTIENRLQLPVRHFAYPFGSQSDFSPESKQVVQKAGFDTAVTTMWGFNSVSADLYELKRFSPWDADRGLFSLKIDWYRFAGMPMKPMGHESALKG